MSSMRKAGRHISIPHSSLLISLAGTSGVCLQTGDFRMARILTEQLKRVLLWFVVSEGPVYVHELRQNITAVEAITVADNSCSYHRRPENKKRQEVAKDNISLKGLLQ